ncbi:phage tail tape measure protein [Glutamicibacter sp.]|uniref:phage tail tape measure protein n=1 Tax=Glutamicibacter sp. TaxID=1931995 RepID=UPI0028BEE56C|nr:phage tail tape measure protein [Glutamicibacter sp.]
MAERRVVARLEAVVQNFINGFKDAKKSTDDLTQSTQNANKATQDNARFSEEAAKKIRLVADADQKAAKNAGLLYNANGQLVNSHGKVVSSSQAAAHGVDQFSEAVYLANVEAQESAAATEVAVAKQAEAYQTLAPAVTVAGGAVTLAFGKMIKTYADFDKSMSEVQAATHESAQNMDLLRDAAVDAGADTAFSAEEAAGGIKELAKAGVDTQDILSGGLSGALSLAASDNIEVAKAAEIAASAITQFKLSGEAVPHVADLLAAGAGKAQGGVEDLGEALNQSGLVANGVGLTIEETTGALAAFASAGLTGSDSGTSFKTMLQSLTPNSKEAAKLMDELGLSAYDASGSFIGMSEYAGVLQNALRDMSDEQRNATLKTIFGSDAVRAANILYEEGAEGIQKWEDAVNDAGFAADTAAAMQNNLAGDLEKLGGSFDTVFLKSGSGANAVLREFVQGAESMIDFVGQIPEPVLAIGGILTGIVGGTLLAGGAIVTFLPKIRDGVSAFKELKDSAGPVPGVIGKIGKAVGIVSAAFAAGSIVGELATNEQVITAEAYAAALTRIANLGTTDMTEVFRDSDSVFGARRLGDVKNLEQAISDIGDPSLGERIDQNLNFMNGWFNLPDDKLTQLETRFTGIGDALGEMVASGNGERAAEAFRGIVEQFEAQGKSAQDAADLMPGYIASLQDVANQAGVTVSDQELLNWAIEGVKPAGIQAAEGAAITESALEDVGVSAEGAVDNMEDFLDVLFQAGVITRDERAAFREYQAAIDDIAASIKENGKSLDEHTEKGRANQAAFDALAQSGEDYVRALAAGGASEEELQSAMTSTYDSLITAAGQFGITGDKADAMARKVMGIPDDVKVSSWMSEAAKKTAEDTIKKTEQLDGMTANVSIIQTYETKGVPFRPQNPIQKQLQESRPSGGVTSLFGRKADGGGIFGPGSGTSDSVPIMASNGEHMLTAREVDLMGGHDSVYRFRAGIRSGAIRGHATGGEIGGLPVGISSFSVMQSSAAPAAAGGYDGPPIEIQINGATDANRVARQVTDAITVKLAERGVNIGR